MSEEEGLLVIKVRVKDIEPSLVDPEEVASGLLYDSRGKLWDQEQDVELVSSEWEDAP